MSVQSYSHIVRPLMQLQLWPSSYKAKSCLLDPSRRTWPWNSHTARSDIVWFCTLIEPYIHPKAGDAPFLSVNFEYMISILGCHKWEYPYSDHPFQDGIFPFTKTIQKTLQKTPPASGGPPWRAGNLADRIIADRICWAPRRQKFQCLWTLAWWKIVASMVGSWYGS